MSVHLASVFLACFALLLLFNHPIIEMTIDIEEDGGSNNDFIHDMCERTTHYNVCVSVLESDPRGDLKSSARGLIRVLVDQALANATTTYAYIGNLFKKATDNATKECLKSCSEGYDRGLGYLKGALGAIDFKDFYGYANLNMFISSFDGEVGSCEEAFKTKPVLKSPLTSVNNYLDEVSHTALQLMNIVYCNHKEVCVEA